MQGRDPGCFDNVRAKSRNVTDRVTFVTKSTNRNIIIFLRKIQTTIIGHKGCDFLAILNQLDPVTLPDGRIWLFGFSPYFFQHNFLCVGSTSKSIGLQGCAQMGFPEATALPGSMETEILAHLAGSRGLSQREKQHRKEPPISLNVLKTGLLF
uniref:Uncharacterized protein n=1 Tax=Panthera leo TaxID=9689 RepID=A0A8C8XFP7_PANLE